MSGVDPGYVALEAIRRVNEDFGASIRKPCVAYLLEGNRFSADRHSVAFVLAVELRDVGFGESRIEGALAEWVRRVDYPARRAQRAIRYALRRAPDGSWKYKPAGLRKPPGGRYHEVLQPICDAVGCPQNCPAFSDRRRRGRTDVETELELFSRLGWPQHLARCRFRYAIATYRAIAVREEETGFPPGAWFYVAHRQLVERSGNDRRAVARHLELLDREGAIEYEPGSGKAGFRRASRVRRVVPVPRPPSCPESEASPVFVHASKAGDVGPPDAGGASAVPAGMEGANGTPPDKGGASETGDASEDEAEYWADRARQALAEHEAGCGL